MQATHPVGRAAQLHTFGRAAQLHTFGRAAQLQTAPTGSGIIPVEQPKTARLSKVKKFPDTPQLRLQPGSKPVAKGSLSPNFRTSTHLKLPDSTEFGWG
jgi:hypothetical protein